MAGGKGGGGGFFDFEFPDSCSGDRHSYCRGGSIYRSHSSLVMRNPESLFKVGILVPSSTVLPQALHHSEATVVFQRTVFFYYCFLLLKHNLVL